MKYLLIILMLLTTNLYANQSPQQVLKSSGFVLVLHENGKEIYYRPKEVQRFNGIVYYSTTTFFTKPVNGITKYSMRSDYMALACKERKVLKTGIHTVPYIGASSYQDLLKQGVKDSSFKTLSGLDKTMYSKVCQSYTLQESKMHISAISTKTSRHETLLPEVFQDLVKAKTPFNVKVNFMGTEFPIPFINGKVANGNVEQSIRNLLKVYFGTVEYEYNMGAIVSAS